MDTSAKNKSRVKKTIARRREIKMMIDRKKRVTIKAIRPYGGEATKELLDFSAKLFGLGLAAALCAAWVYGIILIVFVAFGD